MSARRSIFAEFETADALAAGAKAAREAGHECEAYSPFPVAELTRPFSGRARVLVVIAILAGIVGASLQYGAQAWLSIVHYPLDVGARPLHSWPAFLVSTLTVAVLWSAVASLLGMLVMNRLPRLNHPVFAVPGFERASSDRFFLVIGAGGAGDDAPSRDEAARLLAETRPLRVEEMPE